MGLVMAGFYEYNALDALTISGLQGLGLGCGLGNLGTKNKLNAPAKRSTRAGKGSGWLSNGTDGT